MERSGHGYLTNRTANLLKQSKQPKPIARGSEMFLMRSIEDLSGLTSPGYEPETIE
jgi:hypothetical protein